jgi:tetratricopeptide (TPR) repeat protein
MSRRRRRSVSGSGRGSHKRDARVGPVRSAYIAVFLVAFAVRLAIALWSASLPLVRTPQLDSSQYLAWAGWIADGNHAWPQPIIQGPGYPYFLAGLLGIAGGSLTTVAIFQAVLGAISCVITAALGSRWLGVTAGTAAGLLQAVHGPLAFVETSLYGEGLLLFLTLLSTYVFATRRGSTRGVVMSGILIGAAAIVRATALAQLAVYIPVLLLESPGWRARLRRAAVMATAVAAVTVPVAAKNTSEPAGSFQLQGFAGLNFYIGNSPAGTGTATVRLGAGWESLWGEAWRAGIITSAAQDRYYFRKTFAEIADRPAAWLRVLVDKAVWSTQADEIRDSLSFAFFADTIPVLRWLPGFGLLLSLAAAGALVSIQRRQFPRELGLWLLTTWSVVVLLVVGLRYRMPLVPPVAILAGAGAGVLAGLVREWKRQAASATAGRTPLVKSAAQMAGVAIVVGLLSHAWRHEPSHVLAEEWAFTCTALNTERRFGEAEAACRRAIAINENAALGWKTLGVVLYNTNRLEEARHAHLRALAIDPEFADACLRLAYVESRLGRLDGAVALLRRAAAILPNDLAIRRALGQHLFATRDFRGAVRELEWVLAKTPDDPAISTQLAEARRRVQ